MDLYYGRSAWHDIKPSASGRFYRWRSQGIWQRILQMLQEQAEGSGKINWEIPDRR